MTKKTAAILERLDKEYGTDARCYLAYETPWQLLIATMLSAQCTDARVNMVTKDLFVKYPTIDAFADADLKELERDIHSTGFFHNKAVNIIGAMKRLREVYGGEMPSDIKELTSLPGVGRKTANVVRTHVFREPSVVVDTHVKRVAGKLGMTKETDPVKVEFDLMKKVPRDHWSLINFQLIALGRTICKTPTPHCADCFLQDLCSAYKKSGSQK